MPIKCNSLHLPTIGLLYFLYFAEHLLPKQARFCDNAGQRFPPGEGCWVISLVRDWIPFPQLRSQVDHIDHFDTSQWITKNIHIMLLINKRKHGTVSYYIHLMVQSYSLAIQLKQMPSKAVLVKRIGSCTVGNNDNVVGTHNAHFDDTMELSVTSGCV